MEAVSTTLSDVTAPAASIDDRLVLAPTRRNRTWTARAARAGVMALDLTTVAASMLAAYWASRALGFGGRQPHISLGGYERVGLLALPVWLLVFNRYHLYNARHVAGRRDEVGRLIHASGVSAVATALVAYSVGTFVARSWLALLFAIATTALLVERQAVRVSFNAARRRGHLLRPVALVGTGPEAAAMATTFAENPELGYRVVGVIGEADRMHPGLAHIRPVLDARAKLPEQVRMTGAGGVVVATTDVDPVMTNRIVRTLTDAGIHVELSSSLRDIDASRLSIRPLGRHPVLYVEPVRRTGWRPVAKRAFDIATAGVVLLLTLPVMALAALAIKATSPGPVFFRQERVGYRGKRFPILKFRSMYQDADSRLVDLEALHEACGPVIKMKNDPRVTPIGRLLRASSIDELPQLINVLRGEMSLVGPRPEQPAEVREWTPDLFDRLRVKPGMTGMWQVAGRSELGYAERYRWDLYYVDNWSIWRDLGILFKTIPVVLMSKGAY